MWIRVRFEKPAENLSIPGMSLKKKNMNSSWSWGGPTSIMTDETVNECSPKDACINQVVKKLF